MYYFLESEDDDWFDNFGMLAFLVFLNEPLVRLVPKVSPAKDYLPRVILPFYKVDCGLLENDFPKFSFLPFW